MSEAIAPGATVHDLVDGLDHRPYLFVEHRLAAHAEVPARTHSEDHRSFLVIDGEASVHYVDAQLAAVALNHRYLQGWHAPAGAVYRFSAGAAGATVLEAGTVVGRVTATAEGIDPDRTGPGTPCVPLSSYRVEKPWGHEIWYTQNLSSPGYALKQIHMRAGNQSSLQSHRQKCETNYVIEGTATVLNGLLAPADVTAAVDPNQIPKMIHSARSGWTSAPGVLHRVIATTDYTSVEVSTPELDDVIRWADDTGRASGRIDAEHIRGAR